MDLPENLYLSSSFMKTERIGDVLELMAQEGIRNIELSGGTSPESRTLETLRQCRSDLQVRYQIHNYFPPEPLNLVLNIADPDPAARARCVAFIARSMDLAAELGLKLYSVHAGYLSHLRIGADGETFEPAASHGLSRREGQRIMTETVLKLGEMARSRGIRLAIENLFPLDAEAGDFSLLCRPEEIFSFLEEIAEGDEIGLLLDLGHVHISAEVLEFEEASFIEELSRRWKHKLYAIHLSHNHGRFDDHLPIPARSWLSDLLGMMDLTQVPVTVEVRNGSMDEAKASLRRMAGHCRRPTAATLLR
jgi:sugar phosphate isomerase/epimerase